MHGGKHGPELNQSNGSRSRISSGVNCSNQFPSLILGIIEIDCWFSTYLSKDVIVKTSNVRIMVPSSKKLFEVNMASRWAQMYSNNCGGPNLTMSPYDGPLRATTLEPQALHCKLALIQLRICDAYHTMDENRGRRILEPAHETLTINQDTSLVDDIVSIASNNDWFLEYGDINCAIRWHSSCVSLLSNARTFELATGRGGPDAAIEALKDITIWSQSRAARRACVHAGELYKTLLDRRLSDTVNLHSSMALFQCALVLGFYVLTTTSEFSGDKATTVEIIDHFNWSAIGSDGLRADCMVQDVPTLDEATCSAIDFIRNGGWLNIYGYIHNDGYRSARRILLHFADLMEGMGKWKSRTFSEILHIISDDLMEIRQDDADS